MAIMDSQTFTLQHLPVKMAHQFQFFLANVIPVVYAKPISRKGTVYNTTVPFLLITPVSSSIMKQSMLNIYRCTMHLDKVKIPFYQQMYSLLNI